MKFIILVSTLCIFLSTEGWAAEWLAGSQSSCKLVCRDKGGPITSGTFTGNQQPFTICSTNENNEGFRAGYNLEPNWSNACWVAWNGREVPNNTYYCLCVQ